MASLKKASIKDRIYGLVKKIPEGKVATYGEIAEKLRIESGRLWRASSLTGKLRVDPRIVGWMLHQNKDPKVPCHRVVDRNGRLAPNFGGPALVSGAFNGWCEQQRRLVAEGVSFLDEMHVDLATCLWQQNSKL